MQGNGGLILGQEPKISHATGHPTFVPHLEKPLHYNKDPTQPKKGKKMVAECGPVGNLMTQRTVRYEQCVTLVSSLGLKSQTRLNLLLPARTGLLQFTAHLQVSV